MENCLRLIAAAPKPVLVHCWHGSDRTGIIVAAYRIVYEAPQCGGSRERPADTYGHHEFWYGNLVRLLRSTDWQAMRQRLNAEALIGETFPRRADSEHGFLQSKSREHCCFPAPTRFYLLFS